MDNTGSPSTVKICSLSLNYRRTMLLSRWLTGLECTMSVSAYSPNAFSAISSY